jgi:cob(I)alamin adenosyltransferase
MPRIYTKKGDKGTTSLYNSVEKRLNKSHTIFDVLGDLDELSSYVGTICAFLEEDTKMDDGDLVGPYILKDPNYKRKIKYLRKIQNYLLDIGSSVATTIKRDYVKEITDEDIKELEEEIKYYGGDDLKLKEFILPCVGKSDSFMQIARSVCRRCERNLWKLKEEFEELALEDKAYIFLNRLSSFFFILAGYSTNWSEITRSQANNMQ